MAYRFTYQLQVQWLGAGLGPTTVPSAQRLQLQNAGVGLTAFGAGAGGTLNGADITAQTNAIAADLAAQLNLAANLNVINGWVTGLG